MTDVVKPGDVVMVEPAPPRRRGGAPPRAAAPSRRPLALRQIPAVQGALVSLDPATGRVLAMVGGWSFEASQFNRATQAQRQPGSSFKPMVYLTALEHGISPSQRFLDAPVVVDHGPHGRWRPNNYERDVRRTDAAARGAGEVAQPGDRAGGAAMSAWSAVANTAIAFHMVDNMPRVLPAALGAVDTTVLREAGAYASLDAGGREVVPTLIDSVQDRDGHVVWRPAGLACAGLRRPGHAAATGRRRASRSPTPPASSS